MKTLPNSRENGCSHRGFTLPEAVIAMALFTLVMAGVITSHVAGLKMNYWVSVKLEGTDDARSAINSFLDEVKGSSDFDVGNGNPSSFTAAPDGSVQQGNAVRIRPAGTTNFIYYYVDTTKTDDWKVTRYFNGMTKVVAEYITNQAVFAEEDFTGKILTNDNSRSVVSMTLQFYQVRYPKAKIGPASIFDYYELRSKASPRRDRSTSG